MGQWPARERVGGKARVHKRKRALEPWVGELGIELAHLVGGEHPLVDERAGRERREVAVGDQMLGPLAHHVGETVEVEGSAMVTLGAAARKTCSMRGCARWGAGAETGALDGHLAPAQHVETLLGGHRGDLGRALAASSGSWARRSCRWRSARRQEGRSRRRRRCRARSGRGPGRGCPSRPRWPPRHPRPRGGRAARARSGPCHDPVAGPPVQVRDEAHAAGIVLVRWVVKAGGTRGATDGLGHRHPSGLGSTARKAWRWEVLLCGVLPPGTTLALEQTSTLHDDLRPPNGLPGPGPAGPT